VPTTAEPLQGFGDIGDIAPHSMPPGQALIGSVSDDSIAGAEPTPSDDSQYPQNPPAPNQGNIGDFGNSERATELGTDRAVNAGSQRVTAAVTQNPQYPQNRANAEDSRTISASASVIPIPIDDSQYPQNQLRSEPGDPSGYDGGVPPATSYLLV